MWRLLRAHPLGAVGAAVLGAMAVAAVFAPWLAPYDPLGTNYSMVVRPPSAAHPLGTDQFGRDVLSRIIFGARTALFVGLAASFVSATLGALVGVVTAYVGGKMDLIAQRAVDILLSFPLVILAIAVVAALGAGTLQVIAAIIVPMLPGRPGWCGQARWRSARCRTSRPRRARAWAPCASWAATCCRT